MTEKLDVSKIPQAPPSYDGLSATMDPPSYDGNSLFPEKIDLEEVVIPSPKKSGSIGPTTIIPIVKKGGWAEAPKVENDQARYWLIRFTDIILSIACFGLAYYCFSRRFNVVLFDGWKFFVTQNMRCIPPCLILISAGIFLLVHSALKKNRYCKNGKLAIIIRILAGLIVGYAIISCSYGAFYQYPRDQTIVLVVINEPNPQPSVHNMTEHVDGNLSLSTIKKMDHDQSKVGHETKRSERNFAHNETLACDEDWVYFNQTNACYMKGTQKSWNDAEKSCRLEGAHLTSLHSPEEVDFVISLDGTMHYLIGVGLEMNQNKILQWTDGTPTNDDNIDYPILGDAVMMTTTHGCWARVWYAPSSMQKLWQLVDCNETLHSYTCKKSANV